MISPLVSIVVPIYNAAPYLERTWESLSGQTHDNLEIFLIDDGSQDNSLEIGKDIARRDKRVRVLHHENQGASYTRNRGIECATGDYIMFMDADDALSPYAVETLLQAAEAHHADITVGDVAVFHDNIVPDWVKPNVKKCSLITPEQAYNHLARYEWWGPYAKLYKASFLKQFRFPKETLSEDYFLMVQMFHQARICHHPGTIYAYLKREGSLSAATELTPHSLDELHNTYNAWLYARDYVPNFKNAALHFYTETSVKLATLAFFSNIQEASKCWSFTRILLRKHYISILLNIKSHFALKLRVICIVLGKFTMSITRHFIHHS